MHILEASVAAASRALPGQLDYLESVIKQVSSSQMFTYSITNVQCYRPLKWTVNSSNTNFVASWRAQDMVQRAHFSEVEVGKDNIKRVIGTQVSCTLICTLHLFAKISLKLCP